MADPIVAEQRQRMNELAHYLDGEFNGDAQPKKYAFVLLIAEFDRIEGGRVNYISNGERTDTIAMMKEWIARAEGRYAESGGHG